MSLLLLPSSRGRRRQHAISAVGFTLDSGSAGSERKCNKTCTPIVGITGYKDVAQDEAAMLLALQTRKCAGEPHTTRTH